MGNVEPKQEQKLAVEALLSGKYVMAVLPTGFRQDFYLWESNAIRPWKSFLVAASPKTRFGRKIIYE